MFEAMSPTLLGWYLVIIIGMLFVADFFLGTDGKGKDTKSSSKFGWMLLLLPLFFLFLFLGVAASGGGSFLGLLGLPGANSAGGYSDSTRDDLFSNVLSAFFGSGDDMGAYGGNTSSEGQGFFASIFGIDGSQTYGDVNTQTSTNGTAKATPADVFGAYIRLFGSRFLLTFKILSGGLALASLGGIIYVFIRSQELYYTVPRVKIIHTNAPTVVTPFVREEWAGLRQKLEGASDADAPYLVIEADAIMDRVLKNQGLEGETMGDRLKNLRFRNFKSLDAIWAAHKIRNQVAHEGAESVHYSDAVFALEQYERALREFGVI